MKLSIKREILIQVWERIIGLEQILAVIAQTAMTIIGNKQTKSLERRNNHDNFRSASTVY